MRTIVLLLALASAAFADEYTPVDWLVVTENSEVTSYVENEEPKLVVGVFTLGGAGCLFGVNFTINDATHSIRTTKWQRRQGEDSAWSDVSGTERTGSSVCGMTPAPDMLGEFRLVAEVEVDGAMGKYASRNTLVIAGGPETAVEAVTWGSLKARAMRGPSADRTN